MDAKPRISLNGVYRRLLDAYGPQSWWPADSDFEIAVGAILTQNVSWTNVETAIARLKAEGLLSARALSSQTPSAIAPLIRSTGYYNQKAVKIMNFLAWFSCHRYSFARLRRIETATLRADLLSVNGIGPETADSILLYALSKRVFVVDAYTVRIFGRLGLIRGDEKYHDIQRMFHRRFRGDVSAYNEYHALIVTHGKNVCRKRPLCGQCCLNDRCPSRGGEGTI